MIKNEFQNLGVQNQEIADLLIVPESTLRTWFKRATAIPPKYYGYISGFKIYQSNQKAEDLMIVYSKWENNNQVLLETQKSKALKELLVNEQKNNWNLDQLKQKEMLLLKRLHLSEHYPKYLGVDLQNIENLISWCSILARKSAFDIGNIRIAIQKLEEKKAGLAAQIQYWNGILG